MSGFFSIIQFSMGCLLWGILIALICMVLFYLAIKGWWKNAEFTVTTYITGAVLFILLSFQCILISGGIKILHITDDIQLETERIVNSAFLPGADLTMANCDDVVKQLVTDYPVLGEYFDTGYFQGYTVETLPAAMADVVREYIHSFIIRRLLWCLAFVIVGAVIACLTIKKENALGRSRSVSPIGNRADRQRISRNTRRIRR